MKMLLTLLLAALCLSAEAAENPYQGMNLTDLANHVCAQCGMADTDDVAAAKMFLQRRLEMIWNSELWRSSLIEAVMTLNPDGTCTLSNTVWIPQRSTLLFPPEFGTVLAVRANNHAVGVASLESYYRTDTDWLNMQGDPYDFQVLSPAFYEFAEAQEIYALALNGADVGAPLYVRYSPDGVQIVSTKINPMFGTLGYDIGSALRIISISKAVSSGLISIQYADRTLWPDYVVGNVSGLPINSIVRNANDGNYYQLTSPNISSTLLGGFAANGLVNGKMSFVQHPLYTIQWSGTQWQILATAVGIIYFSNQNVASPDLVTQWQEGPNYSGEGDPSTLSFAGNNTYAGPPSANWTLYNASIPFLSIAANAGQAPMRQRIRLTPVPQVAVSIRVLGKMTCPILGDYDGVPINNAEAALMAFARGDMLLRARQNGKAQIAAQEGASLLQQLSTTEAFHQAGNFRVEPEEGFGGDNIIMQPNSLHPL